MFEDGTPFSKYLTFVHPDPPKAHYHLIWVEELDTLKCHLQITICKSCFTLYHHPLGSSCQNRCDPRFFLINYYDISLCIRPRIGK